MAYRYLGLESLEKETEMRIYKQFSARRGIKETD